MRGLMLSAAASGLVLTHEYNDNLNDTAALAREMKRAQVNVIFVSAFELDAVALWFAVRQADLPLKAWVQIGSESYLRNLCEEGYSGQAVLTVNRTGTIRTAFRTDTLGELYDIYQAAYLRAHNTRPSLIADLSASGVYMLLYGALPQIEGEYTSETVQAGLTGLRNDTQSGLFADTLDFSSGAGTNAGASVIISQQQGGETCSLSPTGAATCLTRLSFPTWRERALQEAEGLACDVDY